MCDTPNISLTKKKNTKEHSSINYRKLTIGQENEKIKICFVAYVLHRNS